MSSPWNKIELPEPKSFQDIMQEELSKNLQEKIDLREYHIVNREELLPDERKCCNHNYEGSLSNDCSNGSHSETLEDALKEKMDLREYHIVDREDPLPDEKEECYDHSYNHDYSSESDDLEDARDKVYWDKYDTVMKKFDPIPVGVRGNVPDVKDIVIIDVIDNKTKLIIKEMMRGQSLTSAKIIAKGKKAIVLHVSRTSIYHWNRNFIIRAFKRKQFNVKRRNTKDNYRCKMKIATKTISSKLLSNKLHKEETYLSKARYAGVACPQVWYAKDNVQFMTFIGNVDPALHLKDANLSPTAVQVAFKQVMKYMRILYSNCKLIHTELNEHHILWSNGSCYLIDLSSAVEIWEENALELLYNDCKKVCELFTSLKVPNIVTPRQLFMNITNCNYFDKVALAELEKLIKRNHFGH